jgi:hypothetical protein
MKGLLGRWGIAFLAVGLSLRTASVVSAEQITVPPRVHPNDPHRFIMNGATWYLAGYTPALSTLIDQASSDTSRYYLLIDAHEANRINSFRNWFTAGQPYGNTSVPYQRTGPGLAADGRPRFDLTKFNQAHFDYFQQVVQYALMKGIVIQLSIFDFWHGSDWVVYNNGDPQHEWGLKHDFYVRNNNINGVNVTNQTQWFNNNRAEQYRRALVAKLIDTVGGFPNLIWEVCNEAFPESRGLPWQLDLADYITSYEQSKGFAPHLVMPRDIPNHENTPGYFLYKDDAGLGLIHSDMVSAHSWNKPLIGNNDSSSEVYTPAYRRKEAWGILTAGGHLDFFHFAMLWQANLNSPDVAEGMRFVGYTRKFLTDLNVNLVGMVPSDGLVTNGWCSARSGQEYVIYLISGGSTTVSGLSTPYTATWFDPRSGMQETAIGGPTFTVPRDANLDWVLHIRRP